MKKRILSMLLAIVMVVGLMPGFTLTASAVDHGNHHSCGMAGCTADHGHAEVTEWTLWDGTTAFPAINGGNVYLTKDVELDSFIQLKNYGTAVVNLCLNGHTLSLKDDAEDYVIHTGTSTLNLCDCKGGGKITNGNGTYAGGVCVGMGSTFNMYGGEISGNTATHGGGGVDMRDNASRFNMYGGKITNNTGYFAGGVYAEDGSFTMYGGEISGNTATHTFNGGGGVHVWQGTFDMRGGKISGNTARNGGGGVYVDGTFNVSGAPVVTGNTKGTESNKTANNVYLLNGKVITISGALTDNADIGVTMQTNGTFTSGWKTKMDGKTPDNYFSSDDTNYSIVKVGDELKIGAVPVDVTFDVTKAFADWNVADGFTFRLEAVTNNAPMPATATATATEEKPMASFGGIIYEAEGTYQYTITEVDGGIPGVTYDTSPHEVVVTVTKGEDNKLSAAVTYDGEDSLIITNTYIPPAVSVNISAVDRANGEAVGDATLQILDEQWDVVAEWTSTMDVNKVEGLHSGKEYTLRITDAPEGYKRLYDISFSVARDGNVTTSGKITTDRDGNTVLLVELEPLYPITLEPETGGTLEADKARAAHDEKVDLTVSVNENYVIAGLFYVNNDVEHAITADGFTIQEPGTYSFEMPMGATTIRAKFSPKVTFVDWDERLIKSQAVEEGRAAEKPDDPIRVGYTFTGWDKDYSNITGPLTLKAQYTPHAYTVKFDANGGSGSMADMPLTYDESKALTASAFVKTNMHFNGWKDSSGRTYADKEAVSNLTTENNGVVVLYAQWADKPAQSITFDTADRHATYGDGILEARKATAAGSVSYSSSDETVATVDKNGIVTVLAAGETIITASAAETAEYASGSVSYKLIVAPKKLTVTADDKEAYVGDSQPELTYKVDGLVDADMLSKAPTLTTDANMDCVGTYTITVSGAEAGSNYTVSHVKGTLTVKELPVCPGDDTCPMAPYTDLKITEWYHEAVDYVLKNGMMQGDGSDKFRPNEALTRSMMVQVLYNLEGKPAVTGKDSFPDTKDGAWYSDAILWASQKGIVLGYDNGNFGPSDTLTREQMATILCRYAKYKGEDVNVEADLKDFTDGDETSSWAEASMQWATAKGILKGTGDGYLCPTAVATRAQIAQILLNYYGS